MKNLLKTFRGGVAAGVLIGFGGVGAISSEPWLSPAIFSVGLIAVILSGSDLYTGKIGYIGEHSALKLLTMLIGNTIGAMLVGLCAWYALPLERVQASVAAKLALKPLVVLIRAAGCGALVYLAVDLYKRSRNLLTVVLPVYVFIVSGLEHCIADMFYLTMSSPLTMLTAKGFFFILLCIIGNSIGVVFLRLIMGKAE